MKIELGDRDTILHILALGTVMLIVLAIFGLFFVKLFLKPMKNSIELLDNFIKDTTHELNIQSLQFWKYRDDG